MRSFLRKASVASVLGVVGVLAVAGVASAAALSAPTAVVWSSTSAKVTFQADSAYVAGTGESYVVTSSPGGLTCSVANVTSTLTGSQSCVVSGLTTDTAYTFTVAESGGTTVDTVSAPSNSVTPVSGLLSVSQYTNFASSFSSGAGGLILPVAVAMVGLVVLFWAIRWVFGFLRGHR